MQAHTPFTYTSLPTRQPAHLDSWRPQTMHASTSEPILEEAFSDDDNTPRASLAQPQIAEQFVARRHLSRDDTVSTTMPDIFVAKPAPEDRLNAWSQAERLEHIRPDRHRPTAFELPKTFELSQASAATFLPKDGSKSLGKKFSRRWNRSMQGAFRSIPGRRRSSVPQDMEGVQFSNQTWTGTLQTPPTRSQRSQLLPGRPKRKWTGSGILGDRKDTPAPAVFNAQQRNLGSSSYSRALPLPSGGESARAAAATHNVQKAMPMFTNPFSLQPSQEELEMRRGRLGSISSAADSGADLSKYDGSDVSCTTDIDGDIEMAQDSHPFDFVKHLPEEISLAVFEKLDAISLVRCQAVSSQWYEMGKKTCVWRTSYLEKYARQVYTDPAPIQIGGIGVGLPGRPDQEWEKMYKARTELDRNWIKGAQLAGKAVYLSGHTDSVYCLQFDEHKIITGSRDRTIRVWDINTFRCLKVIGGPSVKPTPGPKVIRTVDYPHFHHAVPSVNGTDLGDSLFHTPEIYHDASILCLQYDDKHLITGSSDSDLIVWDINTFQPLQRLSKHTGGVLDVALDAKHIVSCSKDSHIIVWDRETYQAKAVLTGHRGPVNAVQLRGHFLVSASGDGIARLWDLRTMKLTKEFSAKERGLAAVEFSEDMKYVLAGGNDHITYKFETETGREVGQFVGHTQLVRSLWLDSANNRVVSGSYDLDLRVYDFVSGQEIWRAEEWTTSWMLAAKSDYRRIVATSQDGRILLVDFGLQKGGREDGLPIPNIELLRGTK